MACLHFSNFGNGLRWSASLTQWLIGMATDYDDMALPTGMMRFASLQPARGGLFSARQRLQLHGEAKLASPFTEDELVEADKS